MKIIADQPELEGIQFLNDGEVFHFPSDNRYFIKCTFNPLNSGTKEFPIVNLADGKITYIYGGALVVKVNAELRIK